ncbi:MAG: deoxyribodipyrimidine photolyase [Ignavibacteriae bacterium HGW-Ignavibacteriae-4]|jgi:deoxyribodipyrimidine photo-lyase|nr:MAG: deoxyribodipyrimidine photolyase [Ignavibacteriae bacterium HGW-Ignavibacteriae-4]
MNTIFWFRRDLRLKDNVGLHNALKNNEEVTPIFIFDENIISELPKNDKRISFIYSEIESIKQQLINIGSDLLVFKGIPERIFQNLVQDYNLHTVYTNHDYEPYSIARDKQIANLLSEKRIEFKTYKDQVIFEKDEIVKANGKPYLVFTPYSKIWKNELTKELLIDNSISKYMSSFKKYDVPSPLISLSELGFEKVDIDVSSKELNPEILNNYHNTRDFPAIEGTSNMSVHLRFGTVSPRELISKALETNEKYLNELIWREFFMSILYHFPHTVTENFHPKYDKMKWRNNESEFDSWCHGKTGFPLIDAGMRELNATGLMHNRVRMVVSNFLTKLLLIDWRWGEEYFAKKLLDYEMSSNVGNWQWAAGTGVDAAPYYRIFRPDTQVERFDKNLEYIRKWIPDYKEDYMDPIINYTEARQRALDSYKRIM